MICTCYLLLSWQVLVILEVLITCFESVSLEPLFLGSFIRSENAGFEGTELPRMLRHHPVTESVLLKPQILLYFNCTQAVEIIHKILYLNCEKLQFLPVVQNRTHCGWRPPHHTCVKEQLVNPPMVSSWMNHVKMPACWSFGHNYSHTRGTWECDSANLRLLLCLHHSTCSIYCHYLCSKAWKKISLVHLVPLYHDVKYSQYMAGLLDTLLQPT